MENQECIICYGDISQNNLTKLQCGHQFHIECVKQWFSSNNQLQLYKPCPYCTKNQKPDQQQWQSEFSMALWSNNLQFIEKAIEEGILTTCPKEHLPNMLANSILIPTNIQVAEFLVGKFDISVINKTFYFAKKNKNEKVTSFLIKHGVDQTYFSKFSQKASYKLIGFIKIGYYLIVLPIQIVFVLRGYLIPPYDLANYYLALNQNTHIMYLIISIFVTPIGVLTILVSSLCALPFYIYNKINGLQSWI